MALPTTSSPNARAEALMTHLVDLISNALSDCDPDAKVHVKLGTAPVDGREEWDGNVTITCRIDLAPDAPLAGDAERKWERA